MNFFLGGGLFLFIFMHHILYTTCNAACRPFHHSCPLHQGTALTPGSRGTWGVVVSNMSVVVQRARREDAGEYTCTAYNPEGFTRSDPIRLEINRESCEGGEPKF